MRGYPVSMQPPAGSPQGQGAYGSMPPQVQGRPPMMVSAWG